MLMPMPRTTVPYHTAAKMPGMWNMHDTCVSHACDTHLNEMKNATHVSHMWFPKHMPQACHFTCVSHVWTVSPKYLIFNQFIFQLKNMWNMRKFTRMCHMRDPHVKHACHMSGIFTGSMPLLVDRESSRVFTNPVVRVVWHEIYQTTFYRNFLHFLKL